MKLYGQSAVDQCVAEKLVPAGYDIEPLEDTLVTGYMCTPPDDHHYWIVFLPHFLNEWSSALELHQYRKWENIPARMKATIEAYQTREEE